MRLLLTSQGLTNQTLIDCCEELLGAPLIESKICFIPTAANPTPGDKSWVSDEIKKWDSLVKQIDIVDIAAHKKSDWLPKLQSCDLIFVNGGNTTYLMEQVKTSGLKEEIPELLDSRVYVGLSAGSYIACPDIRFNTDNVEYVLNGLNLVDFGLQVHMNNPKFSAIATTKTAKQRFVDKDAPYTVYFLDDNSAVKVTDDHIEIVGEGHWLKLDPQK